MFEDDAKLFARSDTEDDTIATQDDLDSLCDWSENWQLSFHPQTAGYCNSAKRARQTNLDTT